MTTSRAIPDDTAAIELQEVKVEKQPNKKPKKKNVPPAQLEHLKTDYDKEARKERLAALEAQRKKYSGAQGFEILQEEHENEAEFLNYWVDCQGTKFDYQEMVIQFGYVTLFSMGFPLCPLIAYLNNLIEMRSDSFKLNSTMQRPQYRTMAGIGMWGDVNYFMVMSSIFVNMVMIVIYDAAHDDFQVFDTSSTSSTIIALAVAEHVIVVLKLLAEHLIPDTTPWLNTAMEGYEYLQEFALKDDDEGAVAERDLEVRRGQVLESYNKWDDAIEEIFQNEARGNKSLSKARAKREKALAKIDDTEGKDGNDSSDSD